MENPFAKLVREDEPLIENDETEREEDTKKSVDDSGVTEI